MDADEVGRLELLHGPVEAVLHSHTKQAFNDGLYKQQWPSVADTKSWISWNIPFGIAATDGQGISDILWLDDNNRPPLEGREFNWVATDCYSVIRDYFWMERGINLPNYPREWKFWEKGESPYLRYFQEAGFIEIPRNEAKKFDCIIYKIMTPNPNHAAVLVSDDMILHQTSWERSSYAYRHKWRRLEVMAVRYAG